MAWSGNFASDYGVPGNKYSPWLQMEWKVRSQSVELNRSYLDLELWVKIEGQIEYYSTMYGSLQGTGFSFSGNQGRNRWLRLSTESIEVQHSRDGTGSVRLYGSYHLKINFSGTNMREMSLSRTIQLPTIAQASSVPSFSFYAPFKENTANWVDLGAGIDAKSPSFTHNVWIMDGSTTLLNLGQVKGGVRWVGISPAQSSAMLRNMSSTTSKNFQLWVQTITSAGANVGNHTLNTAKAYVDDSIVPQITENLSISIAGNGKDKDFGMYMKGISKIQGKFDGTAGYGASVDKFEFVVRRVAGTNVDRTTTQGNNAVRNEHFQYSGQYEAWGVIRDTRGRLTYVPEDGSTIKFNVNDYNAPRISFFNVARNSNNNTQVVSTVRGSFSHLSGQNRLRLVIQRRRIGVGGWSTVEDKYINWSNSFSESITAYNNSTSSSYEFQLEISDVYGNSVSSSNTVSTAKVLMDFNEDIGVGIGKVHELGALDVAGDVYINGYEVWTNGTVERGSNSKGYWIRFPDGTQICYGTFSRTPVKDHTISNPYPVSFAGETVFGSISAWDSSYVLLGDMSDMGLYMDTNLIRTFILYGPVRYNLTAKINYTAIGRWK